MSDLAGCRTWQRVSLCGVAGIHVRTSEALYQACRFPHFPEVQQLVLDAHSPMTAKMRSKPYRDESRPDWDAARVPIMKWCLKVKLAQNWRSFGDLLLATGDLPIVEDSRRDDYWGAKTVGEEALSGQNVLGRLLMELREKLRAAPDRLQTIEPPPLHMFLLLGRPIPTIFADMPHARGHHAVNNFSHASRDKVPLNN